MQNTESMGSRVKAPEPKDTQARVLEAAVRCVERWGMEKVSLGDIAKEAGVTRPTVYSYYDSRDAVVAAALLQRGYEFGERMKAHLRGFGGAEERLIEAVVYALDKLPKEPYLTLITDASLGEIVKSQALTSLEGQKICLEIFQVILEQREDLLPELPEIIEVTVRLLLSMLMVSGPRRSKAELRAFLKRRLVPAVL
ncbi:MAG: TetR/AcrR family transcriptional regulator [Polyangiaceae bacterium]